MSDKQGNGPLWAATVLNGLMANCYLLQALALLQVSRFLEYGDSLSIMLCDKLWAALTTKEYSDAYSQRWTLPKIKP